MTEGIIVKLLKGYGFIKCAIGRDVFFHYSQCKYANNLKLLDKVRFDLYQVDDSKYIGRNITKL